MPANGTKNLKPCKKGETANPNGRPKGRKSITTYLKQFVEAIEAKELEGNKPIQEILDNLKKAGFDSIGAGAAYNLIKLAFNQHNKPETQMKAIETIMDRLDGKPLQKAEISGPDGEALIKDQLGEQFKTMSVEQLRKIRAIMNEGKK